MARLRTTYTGSWPHVHVSYGGSEAYGLIMRDLEEPDTLYLHRIYAKQRRRHVGTALLRAYVQIGMDHDAELFSTVPVTEAGYAFFHKLLGDITPVEPGEMIEAPLEQVQAHLANQKTAELR